MPTLLDFDDIFSEAASNQPAAITNPGSSSAAAAIVGRTDTTVKSTATAGFHIEVQIEHDEVKTNGLSVLMAAFSNRGWTCRQVYQLARRRV